MAEMVGRFQEWLQRRAPGLGMVCDELYTVEFAVTEFRCRIILLNTTPQWRAAGHSDELPWCPPQQRKKDAKGCAAKIALDCLEARGMSPHNPYAVHVHVVNHVAAVHVAAVAHNDMMDIVDDDEQQEDDDGLPPALPPLTADLLDVGMEMCSVHPVAAPSPRAVTDGDVAETDTDSACDSADDVRRGSEPPNVGRLGEEFAATWLASHWQCEVRWLNADAEQQADYDLTARRNGDGGAWTHVEVKTRWRGCKLRRSQLSPRQLGRLLDPNDADHYVVLVIGDARNLFADPPRPPGRVRMHSVTPPPGVPPGSGPSAATFDAARIFSWSAGPTGSRPQLRFRCQKPAATRTTDTYSCKGWRQSPWTMALALEHPAMPAAPGVTQYPFLESFEGPPQLEHHSLHVGDTAFVVTVRGTHTGPWDDFDWEFWYTEGADDGLAVACARFNLLCRQFCRIHLIRKDDPSTVHKLKHDGDDFWGVTMERVRFGSVSGERPGTYHQDHDPARPYRLKRPPMVHVGAGMYFGLSMEDAGKEARRAQREEDWRRGLLCDCSVCLLRQGMRRHLWAEWRMDSDSGRTTGLKQGEESVVGYHSCVPAGLRETLSNVNVRDDNIDDDKRHVLYH